MNKKLTQLIQLITLTGLIMSAPLSHTTHAAEPDFDLTKSSIIFDSMLQFGSGYSEDFDAPTGTNESVNLNEKSNPLSILSAGFRQLGQETEEFSDGSNVTATGEGEARITKQPLVYPNPFKQSQGAKLGYGLAGQISEIEIQFYDMMANLILKKTFKDQGARQGYNLIDINLETFDGYALSAGVYFYLIINNGKVLGKGKVAVIP
jgi:hypothetical protein